MSTLVHGNHVLMCYSLSGRPRQSSVLCVVATSQRHDLKGNVQLRGPSLFMEEGQRFWGGERNHKPSYEGVKEGWVIKINLSVLAQYNIALCAIFLKLTKYSYLHTHSVNI